MTRAERYLQDSADGKVAEKYIRDITSGRIAASSDAVKCFDRHLDDLKNLKSYKFNPAAGIKPVRFFHEFLSHHKGEWAGKPITLEPWQQAIIYVLFGWQTKPSKSSPKPRRRFKTALVEVPRKNGKTTMAGGIALYMLDADGEAGAEVYSFAPKKDQAKICFNEAQMMVRQNMDLADYFSVTRDWIKVEETGSKMIPLGRDKSTMDGLNAHCAIIDEGHAIKDSQGVDVLESSMGARTQPMMLHITTAGYNKNGYLHRLEQTGRNVINKVVNLEEMFFIRHGADEGDDWHDPETWQKANPNYDISVKPEYLEKMHQEAAVIGLHKEIEFKTKFCNLWVDSQVTWIGDEMWKAQETEPDIDLTGRECYAGLDLANTRDFTALTLIFPRSLRPGFYVRTWYFMPEETLLTYAERNQAHPVLEWAKQGRLVITPGNAQDHDQIRKVISGKWTVDGVEQITQDCLANKYAIKALGFDPWNATQIIGSLVEDGIKCEPHRTGFGSMSVPSKQMEILASHRALDHGNDPVLRWMVANTIMVSDPSGNIKPDKSKAEEKIDGVVSLIIALGTQIKITGTRPNTLPSNWQPTTL